MTRAALLTRVSSSAQSADMQLEELRAVAAQRGWKVVLEATDVGSGAAAELPGRTRVLELARRGGVDVIAVWRLDRLGRSLRDLIAIADTLRKYDVELVSLRDAIETHTPAGQLLFSVLGAIAQFERELIGERVRAGLAAARARGVVVGRPRADVNLEAAAVHMGHGDSVRAAARKIGVSPRTLSRALVTVGGDARRVARLARLSKNARQKPLSGRPSKRPRKRLSRARARARGRK